MATAKKPTTEEKAIITEVENADNKKMEDLEIQLAKAMAMIETLTKVQTNNTTSTDDKIDSEEVIPVISQCVGELCLTLDGKGNGIPYIFSEFGDIQDIPFGELKTICKNNRSFLDKGLFYVAHEKAAKQLRLTNLYKKLLSNEDMIHLLEKDSKTIIDLYNLAPDSQKETIIKLIADQKLNGATIDANVLITLGQLSGKDLINIEK